MDMQAVAFRQYGTEDVLDMLKFPKPIPSDKQVLIRVVAAGVNPADGLLRKGQFKAFIRLQLPFIPGLEVAGIVEQVGAVVTEFRPGQRVYASMPTSVGGGYGQYVAVEASNVAVMPDNLSFAEAAGVPLTGLTALQALRDIAKLGSGSHILINGASGGVGTFAVQIARALGARVTATCSDRNMALVKSLQPDRVLDYTTYDGSADKSAYDYVFDAVNALPLNKALQMIKRGGMVISVNPILGNPISRTFARFQGRDVHSVNVHPSGKDLLVLRDWIENGKIFPVIGQTFKLSEAAEAQRISATRRARGKLILRVDETVSDTKENPKLWMEMEREA